MKGSNCEIVDEILLLAYFTTELAFAAPHTMQAVFSMLKAQVGLEFDIDITKYIKLRMVLQRKSEKYVPKYQTFFKNLRS